MIKSQDNSNYVEKNKIYHMDCIKLLDRLKEQKIEVDLIITDPPYNISRKNNFKTIGRSGIDFGEWDKDFDQLKWLNGISCILSKNGSILIFNDWKNMGIIAKKLENEGFEIKDLIRWIKPAPMPRNTNRRYVTDYEFILWAVKKGSRWVFNKNNDKPYLRPRYEYAPPGSSRIHPTEKPEKLIEDLINIHSNKGDLILDLFSGSGVISAVADKLDRYYIACEKNKKYFEASINRIKKNYIRPAFNHLGNKTRMMPTLIANFPKKSIKHFIEPFAGSGIVSISYQTPQKYWLNDNDKNIFKILEYLFNNKKNIIINDIENIIDKYNLPKTNKKDYTKEYEDLKNDYNKNKDIKKLFVLVLYGFNQQIRFNSNGDFNIPPGKFYWTSYQKEKIENFIEKKDEKNFEIRTSDFEIFVNDIKEEIDKKESFFYFDPPYYLSSATYNSIWKEADEKRLINLLQSLTDEGYKWCLSNVLKSKGNENIILKKFIENNKDKIKWKFVENINYKNSNYQRSSRELNDEEILIWGNYEC